jgi:hypothetical protein
MSAEILHRRSAACSMLEVARRDLRTTDQLHYIAFICKSERPVNCYAVVQQCATTAVSQTRLCLPALSTEPTTPPLCNRPDYLTHSSPTTHSSTIELFDHRSLWTGLSFTVSSFGGYSTGIRLSIEALFYQYPGR